MICRPPSLKLVWSEITDPISGLYTKGGYWFVNNVNRFQFTCQKQSLFV